MRCHAEPKSKHLPFKGHSPSDEMLRSLQLLSMAYIVKLFKKSSKAAYQIYVDWDNSVWLYCG